MNNTALNMVLGQLYPNKIQNPRLLEAITSTRREHFVPPAFAKSAYSDAPLPYGNGRFMPEPLVTASMLSLADLSSTDNLLIVGAGLGYTVAVASRLAATVVGIESESALANSARVLLSPYAPKARVEHVPDLAEGYLPHAPYDAIIIEGAVSAVPQGLAGQLKPGGRLVLAVAFSDASVGVIGRARLAVYLNTSRALVGEEVGDCSASLLSAFAETPGFAW